MIPAEQFRGAIQAAQLTPPDTIEPDGQIHRFPTNGKRSDDSGWYVFHDGRIPAGAFGDWRSDVSGAWRADIGRELTSQEKEEARRSTAKAKAQAEAERVARQETAAAHARKVWDEARPAPDDHVYLLAKGIKAHGLRVYDGKLVVSMRDAAGNLRSLQIIDGKGKKRFLTGGRVAGCYYGIGKPDGVLCVAEGYATGASIHEATGHAVAIAFNAGNLLPVAEVLREKFPDVRLIICADDDAGTTGNPGITKATEATRAVGGLMAVPDFGETRPDGVTDFNDLAQHRGAEAVKRSIENAQPPQIPDCQPSAGNATVGGSASEFAAYRRISEIEAKPIHWLWPGRIARGKVSMIAGNPGLGKSQAMGSIAAIVTTGGRWPVDKMQAEQGSVVILSAEDDAADTIRPRLEATGANLDRVFILDAVREVSSDGKAYERGFNLKKDLATLGAMLTTIGDAALVIIDPVTAYLGETDSHKNAEVRALLAPLSELAAKHGVAVVCISHLNKGTGNDALMRVMGSLAFVAAARAAWIVAKDPEDERRRLFLPAKNNIANDQSGLAFSIRSAQVESSAGVIDTSVVEWEAEAVAVSVNDVVGSQADSDEGSTLAEAKEFLAGLLTDGPLSSKQIRTDANGAGYAWRTIRRAQKALGVQAAKEGQPGDKKQRWRWRLPSKVATEDVHQNNLATFGESRTSKGFNHAGSVEDGQVPMIGHLRGDDGHLRRDREGIEI